MEGRRKVVSFILCLSLVSATTYYYYKSYYISPGQVTSVPLAPQDSLLSVKTLNQHTAPRPSCQPLDKFYKPILYLTQTEGCLPPNLVSAFKADQCNCDVIVLSYKQTCTDSKLSHVEYLFNSTTTWGSGRNILYNHGLARAEKYLYYIIMDDDLTLRYKNGFNSDMNPWRYFEQSLLREQWPVVGLDFRTGRLESLLKAAGLSTCNKDFIPTNEFDGMFSAFHYKSITNLLPYHDEAENFTWWYTHFYVYRKASLLYHGFVGLSTRVYADNPKHRPYPRQAPDDKQKDKATATIVQEIKRRFPGDEQLVSRDLSQKLIALTAREHCSGPPDHNSCPSFPGLLWN